jgi:hypothetical protein
MWTAQERKTFFGLGPLVQTPGDVGGGR